VDLLKPTAPTAIAIPVKYVRLPEVIRLTGMSKSTIRRMMDNRKFPRAYRLSSQAIGWRESEVQQWLAERKFA